MATPRFPFQLKLLVLAGALGVVPTVAVGIGLIDVNARAVERESRALQMAVADDVVRTIEEEASRVEAKLSLAVHVLANPEVAPDARVAVAPALVEGDSAMDHLAIYDAQGALIDVARGEGAGAVDILEELPRAVRAELTEADLHVGRVVVAGGEPRVPFTMPIEVDGEVTGYVYSLARLAGVQARVERIYEAQFAGSRGMVYVVDEDLRLLAHPNAEQAYGLPSVRQREILRDVDPPTLSPGVPRTSEAVADGVEVLGTVVGLEARPWAVVVEVPLSVAYASLEEMRRLVILSTTVAALLAFAIAFFLARRITAPIGSLVSFAEDLAHRRFSSRVSVDTGDELEILAAAMSFAAAALEESEAQIGRDAAIRADLGRYLPEELVEKVVAREQDMGLGGARREVTVLFADVVAFTPLTERLGPEEVVSLLNELFTILTELVFRHGGTVDKFVGDCVMAVFGAPTAQSDHARRALDCAEDMMRWLSTANPGWEKRYGATVQLAIGVHSGEAIVGNIGSERRMEYTAIGDVVNVAARLEAIARPMQILVSSTTKEAAGESHDFVEVGERVLSGRQDPIELWEVHS